MGHFSTKTVLALSLILQASIVTTAVVSMQGCVKMKAPPNGGGELPPAPTAQYNLQKGLAALADINKSATQLIIALNKQGSITDDLTREYLKYFALVAQSAKSGTIIMQSNKSNKEKAAAINALMIQLPLPDPMKKFTAAGMTGELVIAAITAITSSQTIIQMILSNAGGLQ